MKKILAILMAMMLVIGLCACGNNSDSATTETDTPSKNNTTVSTDESTDAPTTEDTGNKEENDTNFNFFDKNGALVRQEVVAKKYEMKETASYKDKFIEVTLTKCEATDTGVTLNYSIKNLHSCEILCEAYMYEFNGYTVDFEQDRHASIACKSGETVDRTITFTKDAFADSDLTYINSGSIHFAMTVPMDEFYDDVEKYSCSLSFNTTTENANHYYTDGEVLYDKDGLKITLQYIDRTDGLDKTSARIEPLRIFVENTTNTQYNIAFKEVLLNGDANASILPKRYSYSTESYPETNTYYILSVKNEGDVKTVLDDIDKIENFKVELEFSKAGSANTTEISGTVNTKR